MIGVSENWDPYFLKPDEESALLKQTGAAIHSGEQTLAQGPLATGSAVVEGFVLATGRPMAKAFNACTSTSVMEPGACGAAIPGAAFAAWGAYGFGKSVVGMGEAALNWKPPSAIQPAVAGIVRKHRCSDWSR